MSVSFSTITQKARMQPLPLTSVAMRRALTYIPPTVVSPLKNGVRIASEENPSAKFATVGIWLDVGTKYETREKNGLLKVLHEAAFQGTKTHDRKALSSMLDEVGGHLLTKTDREHSYIGVKCTRENVNKAVGILSDIVRNARLSNDDVNTAKQIVEHQRKQAEEDCDDLTSENLHICAYDASENGGLGLCRHGSEAGIKNVNAKDLEEFRTKHYTGPRMCVVGAGAVNHTELEKAAQQYLGDVASADNKPKPNARYVGGDYRLWNLRMKLCHMMWGVETMGAASGDKVALELATHIHGGWHRSQGELGQHAAHRVIKIFSSMDFGPPTNTPMPETAPEIFKSYSKFYEDTGLVGMYAVVRPVPTGPGWAGSHHDILQYSMYDWARMTQKMMHDQEVDQAKVNMKAQLLFNMDGATNTFEDIGTQVFQFGRRVPLDEMYARIDDITPNNLQEVLMHYYHARRPVLSLYGYNYIIPAYDCVYHWTYKYWH